MQNLDNRLASFEAVGKPKNKAKPAWPLSPSTHPYLTPDSLSEAGFYHTPGPSSESYDNCKCFLCNVELGGWDEEDDPFEEHARRGGCAWAEMVCGVKLEKRKRDASDGAYTTTYANVESLPQSKESATVREQTFKKWWPHKQKAGWLPTVKNLARAGFVYNPSTESKDLVTCPYCSYSVEGWEATDDPWQIHESKVPDCHYFRAQVDGAEIAGTGSQSKSKAAARGKKSESSSQRRSKRATTATAAAVTESEAESDVIVLSGDDEPEAPIHATTEPAATKKRTTKPRATTTKAKATGTRGKKKAQAEEEEEEEAEDETITEIVYTGVAETGNQAQDTETPAEPARKTRGKANGAKTKTRARDAKAKNRKKADEEHAEEEAAAPVESEIEAIEEESEVEVEAAPKADTNRSSRSQASKTPSSRSAVTAPIQASSSTSRSAKSSKPLPSLPPATPTSPSPEKRPLSQLDRFANIPLSSPVPTPRSKSTLRSTQPSKPSPHAGLPRDVLENSLTRGALEARRVMQDLVSSPAPSPSGPSRSMRAEESMQMAKLTEEQKSMTLEELVRAEMKKRYDEMKQEGEEMIEKWEQKAKSERRRIEAM
ncbi:hypothetical protein IAU60_001713 [Kwoniella sp. DSM 27419]